MRTGEGSFVVWEEVSQAALTQLAEAPQRLRVGPAQRQPERVAARDAWVAGRTLRAMAIIILFCTHLHTSVCQSFTVACGRDSPAGCVFLFIAATCPSGRFR